MPMQYTEILKFLKNENFSVDIVGFIFCSKHRLLGRGGSNEYPQSMFWSKNKKNGYTPANPSFTILKWGSREYTLHGHVFLMHNTF